MKRIMASEDMAKIIERGAEVDTEIKNLTFEDKGIKAKLVTMAGEVIGEDTSVRFSATHSAAVISAIEKVEFDASAEKAGIVKDAVRCGLLGGVVEWKQSLIIPPGQVENARKILNAAGISSTIEEDWEVKPSGYREFTGSTHASIEADNLGKVLKGAVRKTVTYRVKYERA